MKFSPSKFIDIKVNEPDKAAKFYTEVYGLEKLSPQGHTHTLKFGEFTVFITKSEFDLKKSNIHFEMSTSENIEKVREYLISKGCSFCQSGMENAYMFTDPFGNNVHIYQEK